MGICPSNCRFIFMKCPIINILFIIYVYQAHFEPRQEKNSALMSLDSIEKRKSYFGNKNVA